MEMNWHYSNGSLDFPALEQIIDVAMQNDLAVTGAPFFAACKTQPAGTVSIKAGLSRFRLAVIGGASVKKKAD